MLSYVLAGVGLLLAALSTWVVIKHGLNHQAANAMFVKLASMGAVDRMRKLCRASPKGGYFDAIDAAVAAGMAARTRESAALTATVEAAYDKVGREVGARWKASADRGLVGVILVGAACGLVLTDDRGPAPVLWLGVVGALVGAFLLKKRGRMMEALVDGRVVVLPALVEALAKGDTAPATETTTPARVELVAAPSKEEPMPMPDAPLPPGNVRLRILRDGRFVRSQTLDEAITKIGRLERSHLHLDDENVSRMHAVIECGDEDVSIIDLGSATGTRVNGQRINKTTLRAGDVIEIGPFRLEVERGAPPN